MLILSQVLSRLFFLPPVCSHIALMTLLGHMSLVRIWLSLDNFERGVTVWTLTPILGCSKDPCSKHP